MRVMRKMPQGWVSVVPFVVAIAVAMLTRQVLVGLVLGLLYGSAVLQPGVVGTISRMSGYVLDAVGNEDNLRIIVFLYTFGGLIGMMHVAGGIKGFSNLVRRWIASERAALLVTWSTVLLTFMDCEFRIMTTGPVMKAVIEKVDVAKTKLAYAIDVSTIPVIVLIPVATTYVGYMVSVVGGALGQAGLSQSPYEVFVASIPFNFWAITILLVGLFSILTGRYIGPGFSVQNAGAGLGRGKEEEVDHRKDIEQELSDVRPKALNLILPLLLLLSSTFYLIWSDGVHNGATSVVGAIQQADATQAMLIALFLTTIVSFVLFLIKRERISELMFHFVDGGNQVIMAILLLTLVWAMTDMSEDLGFSSFITGTVGVLLPRAFVPVGIFLFGSLLAYFIGSSWGTWGLLMPLAVSVATATGAAIPVTVGAVFAAGSFGDFSSPLGETTVTTAAIFNLPVVDYAKTKLYSAITAVVTAAVLFVVSGLLQLATRAMWTKHQRQESCERGRWGLRYKLQGLDCANCASKIERKLRSIPGLEAVTVNFASQSVNLPPGLFSEAQRLVARVEPGVRLVVEHDASESMETDLGSLAKVVTGLLLLLLGVVFGPALNAVSPGLSTLTFAASYLIAGAPVLLRSFGNIRKGRVFDENSLMTAATIGAFSIGQPAEAAGVMVFYSIGEYFQDKAVRNSRRSIAALLNIRPDFANLVLGDEVKRVKPTEIDIGDLILVRPGEKVPLDGEVVDGVSFVDTSALTGESVPQKVEPGETVLAASINREGLLRVRVTKTYGESSVARILSLVEEASERKAPTEHFITNFARWYTPGVVLAALALALVPPLVVPGQLFRTWIGRALVFLVISCPCALVVSIPLGYFGGLGAASRQGVLVKGANFLDALTRVETVVFNKTGTLTKGVFKVTKVQAGIGFNEAQVLRLAAVAEVHSRHPIAQSITKAFGEAIAPETIQQYQEIAGHGVRVEADGHRILAGNEKLMASEGLPMDMVVDSGATIVHIGVDGQYAGNIVISDELKEDAERAVDELRSEGVRKLYSLSGDREPVVKAIADRLGLDGYYSDLLPEDKVRIVEELKQQTDGRSKLVFIGDGINDAPVITRADIGVAMGGLGSDAAIEAADVVLMQDAPSRMSVAIRLARKTNAIVKQNIVFALVVKFLFLGLGALGVATIWEAVFADVGVTILTVLNATRALRAPTSPREARP